jgi:hypothetical protein
MSLCALLFPEGIPRLLCCFAMKCIDFHDSDASGRSQTAMAGGHALGSHHRGLANRGDAGKRPLKRP